MADEQKVFWNGETKLPLIYSEFDYNGADMHWHNWWEILVQHEGETKITVGKENFISKPGNITVIGRNQLHKTRSVSGHHKILVLYFDSSVLMPFTDLNGGYKYMPLLMNDGYQITNRVEEEDEEELGESLYKLYLAEKETIPGYEFDIYAWLLHTLSLLIAKKYITISSMDRETKKALLSIKEAMVYIEQNYNDKIYQSDMAEMCFMSQAHFSRQFKKATGQNMVDYINKIRLTEVCRMLATSNESILDISSRAGFSNVNYFNRVFKNMYGMSPREYKQKKISF